MAVKEKYCWKLNRLRDTYEGEEIFEIGALLEPIGCPYNGIFITGEGLKPGETFVVYDAGPTGLASIALAKTGGASKIIAFDKVNERLELAKIMGADFVLNTADADFRAGDKILEITNRRGADIQVEAGGAAHFTIPEMERSLAGNGKILYLGRVATSTPKYLDILVSGANKIIGSRGHAGGIYNNIIRLVTSGRLKIKNMIALYFSFKDILKAIQKSVDRSDGKIMVRIS